MSGNGKDAAMLVEPEDSMRDMLAFMEQGIADGSILGIAAFAMTEDGVQPITAGNFSRAQATWGACALIKSLLEED